MVLVLGASAGVLGYLMRVFTCSASDMDQTSPNKPVSGIDRVVAGGE